MGLFTPFAYIRNKVLAGPVFNPNDLANLTFWIDFSDSNFYTTSGTDITEVYSKVAGATSHTLNRVNVSNNFYTLADSLSNSSLKSAKVVTRPTTYRASSWNTATDAAIVLGPKTNTTSNPDGTMFVVYNRGSISTAGYLISRFTGTVDRGVQYNLATGTPQTDIIGYDQNSPAYQFYNTTDDTNVILTRVNNGANSTIYNGAAQMEVAAKNDAQNRTTRQFHNIGMFGSPTAVGDTTPVNIQYCEVIMYNRVLTDLERNQVITYLANKWNIGVATDVDAQAFLTATGITDATTVNAINSLVIALKGSGLWTKMAAIYPFVGGTATTHKYNLKDPRDLDAAYRISFSGGWTHSSAAGITPNGTNASADTFFTYTPGTAINDFALSYWTTTTTMQANIGGLLTFGANTSEFNSYAILLNRTNVNWYSNMGADAQGANFSYSNVGQSGLGIASRTSTTSNKIYRNGVLLATNASTNTGTWPARNVHFGNPTSTVYTTMNSIFASISTGLTDDEASRLYLAAQNFQTMLGR
jgi:hypothetical protein